MGLHFSQELLSKAAAQRGWNSFHHTSCWRHRDVHGPSHQRSSDEITEKGGYELDMFGDSMLIVQLKPRPRLRELKQGK